jgi:hypothetical protein
MQQVISEPDRAPQVAPSANEPRTAASPTDRFDQLATDRPMKRPKPTTIQELVEYAYAEAGRKVQLARRDLELLRVSPDLAPAEMDTLRKLAATDPLLQVPPRLLALVANLGTRTDLRDRILDLAVAALAAHPAFQGQVQALVDSTFEPGLSGERVSDSVKGMPAHGLGLDSKAFKPDDRERLRVNAVTAFGLIRVLRDREPLDRFIGEMAVNVWQTSGRNPKGAGPAAASLAATRDVDALGLLSRHYRSVVQAAEQRAGELRADVVQAQRRAGQAAAASRAMAERLDAEEQRANDLSTRLRLLEAELEEERSHRTIDKTHAVDDYQLLRARVVRQLGSQVDLLSDGLHALRNGRMAVAEEFVDRALTAIQTEVGKLKEFKGGSK